MTNTVELEKEMSAMLSNIGPNSADANADSSKVKWGEQLTTFANELEMNRQIAALVRLDTKNLLALRDLCSRALTRKKKDSIKEFLALMEESDITVEDLQTQQEKKNQPKRTPKISPKLTEEQKEYCRELKSSGVGRTEGKRKFETRFGFKPSDHRYDVA